VGLGLVLCLLLHQLLNSITKTLHGDTWVWVCVSLLGGDLIQGDVFVTISTMIANGVPSQPGWHLTRAVHHGATVEEVRAVQEIALRIAIKAGVPLKTEVLII
jgi:hypothetical protein